MDIISKLKKVIKTFVINTTIGDFLVNEVRIRGIDEKIPIFNGKNKTRKQYAYDVKFPTSEMLEARKYFHENKERISLNLKLLADDESRECYVHAIKYRCTHNKNDAPVFNKQRYFVKGIIELSEDEIFIDGGAFVGDTVRKFCKLSHQKYKRVISFEADKYNYKMLKKLKYKKFYSYNIALWDSKTKLNFFNNMDTGSKVVDEVSDNVVAVEADKLDNIKGCKEATFIKLDIEGSELAALRGAKNIIQNNRPKLVVCLYHSNEDMLQIIEYVHMLVPEYKLYVRHHSEFVGETVLYAVMK